MKLQPDKQHILNSLDAIARGGGRPPSRSEFVSLTGISEHSVSQFFPTWNAALRAAGLPPYTLNLRLEDGELLEDWGYAVRRNRKIPARRTYRHLGKFDHRTFERRFGPWSQLPKVFRNFAQDKPEWADVLALLPLTPPKPSTKRQPVAPALLPMRSSSPDSASAPTPVILSITTSVLSRQTSPGTSCEVFSLHL
ncbi:MAG: hypothetical protein WBE13_04820 [Candidatus Acidiferrum sp.]